MCVYLIFVPSSGVNSGASDVEDSDDYPGSTANVGADRESDHEISLVAVEPPLRKSRCVCYTVESCILFSDLEFLFSGLFRTQGKSGKQHVPISAHEPISVQPRCVARLLTCAFSYICFHAVPLLIKLGLHPRMLMAVLGLHLLQLRLTHFLVLSMPLHMFFSFL